VARSLFGCGPAALGNRWQNDLHRPCLSELGQEVYSCCFIIPCSEFDIPSSACVSGRMPVNGCALSRAVLIAVPSVVNWTVSSQNWWRS